MKGILVLLIIAFLAFTSITLQSPEMGIVVGVVAISSLLIYGLGNK